MSYTPNKLSTMLRNACLALAIVGVGVCLLWVNSLKHTIQLRDDTIGTLNSVNTELKKSNDMLRSSLDDERDAVKREVLRNAELKQQLHNKLSKFNNAAKDDKCANTVAPDDIVDSVQ